MSANKCEQCTLGTCGVVDHGVRGLIGGRTLPSYNSDRITASDISCATNVLRDAMAATDSKGRVLHNVRIKAARALIDKVVPNAPVTNVNLNNQLDDDKLQLVIEYLGQRPAAVAATAVDDIVTTDIRYQISEQAMTAVTDGD